MDRIRNRNTLLPYFVATLLLAACFTQVVRADEWLPARQTTYRSDNDAYRFKVLPGRPPDRKSPDAMPVRAKGTLFASRRGGSGQRWEATLSNPIAPALAIVSNTGRHVATFDNWASVGYGGDVVVIIGEEGRTLYSYSLEEILDSAAIARTVTQTEGSRWWRAGDPAFDASEENLVLPTTAGEMIISLADGKIRKNGGAVTHWADGAETEVLLKRFLEIYRESRKLREDLRRGRDSKLSKQLDQIESEGASIVKRFSGVGARDDYRRFDDESMVLLLEASRRFDRALYKELVAESDRVNISNTRDQLKTISAMLYAYEMRTKRFPPDNEGLEVLTFAYDRSAYLEVRDLKDAWGRPFIYSTEYIASPAGKPFILFSAGPDGIQNTPDDIFPPDEE